MGGPARTALALAATLLTGCDDPGTGSDVPPPPVRDAAPDVVLDGDTWLLSRVLPGLVTADAQGRIYVGDARSQAIHAFDSTGSHLFTVGGSGDGPAEFRQLIAVGTLGDTLYGVNFIPPRVVMFSETGAHLGTLTVSAEAPDHLPSPPTILLPGGRGVASLLPVPGREIAAERHVSVLLDSEGRILDTLYAGERDSGMLRLGSRTFAMAVPFPDDPLYAVSEAGERVAVIERALGPAGGAAAYRVTQRSFSGDTLYSERYEDAAIPIPGAVRDSVRAARIATLRGVAPEEDAGRLVDTHYPVPAHYPPIEEAFYADDGGLWLRRATGDARRLWEVHDPASAVLYRVELPPGTILAHAGGDFVLAIQTDEFRVPSVVRYRLQAVTRSP